MSYSVVDHTADLGIRVEAGDISALFAEAAKAMILETGAGSNESQASVEFVSRGFDREDLLVAFLNDILFYITSKGFRVAGIEIIELSETSVTAVMKGAYNDNLLAVCIKAATHHSLEFREKGGKLETVIIFDV